jgi:hypothetical protein
MQKRKEEKGLKNRFHIKMGIITIITNYYPNSNLLLSELRKSRFIVGQGIKNIIAKFI